MCGRTIIACSKCYNEVIRDASRYGLLDVVEILRKIEIPAEI